MFQLITRYYHWLHGKWPAGSVESLPIVGEAGVTNLSGVRVVGDLSGIPLLKFASETGVQALRGILEEASFAGERERKEKDVYDVAIVGAGVSGISAAMEAEAAGLRYLLIEASQRFATVANFPKGKAIFTYPSGMTPSGGIQYGGQSAVKESLLQDMKAQARDAGVVVTAGRIECLKKSGSCFLLENVNADGTEAWKALRVIVSIGRSGNFRSLDVPGEDLDKVSNRLHDPKEFAGKDVLVVGGGDSAAEAAIALTASGAKVTLSYRKTQLTRPKPENIEQVKKLAENPCADVAVLHPSSERVTTAASSENREGAPGGLRLALGTEPTKITTETVLLKETKESIGTGAGK